MPESKNRLGAHVRRIMELKGLSQKDVALMSGGRITAGYVASITTTRADNLSVAKLVALAEGLGVDPDELFRVARGVQQDERKKTQMADAFKILEIVQKAVASPEVTEILNEAARMSPEQRRLLLKSIKRVGATKSERRHKSKPRRSAKPRSQES